MEIKTVQIQGDSYLVNGTLSVPKADENRDYQAVKIWLETNEPDAEFTEEELLAKVTALTVTEAKMAKEKALEDIVITHNTVAYDADDRAIGNMSAVMGIANFKYNQLLAQDVLPSDAYLIIYKETKIFWKGADDKPHEIMIESVCEALEMSMLEVAKIIGV